MFSVKIFNNNSEYNFELEKTVNNIVNFIYDKLGKEGPRITSSNNCTEIVTGKEPFPREDEIVVELLIRKHIIINNSDFKDREILDRHLSKIKNFCEKAKTIEEIRYTPINMR